MKNEIQKNEEIVNIDGNEGFNQPKPVIIEEEIKKEKMEKNNIENVKENSRIEKDKLKEKENFEQNPDLKERKNEPTPRKETDQVVEEQKMPEKKKRNIFAWIITIVATLLFLFIIFETVTAFLNFNLINNEKEPTYFVTKTKDHEQIGSWTYTVYEMRLYKIVRKENETKYEIRMMPFFQDYITD